MFVVERGEAFPSGRLPEGTLRRGHGGRRTESGGEKSRCHSAMRRPVGLSWLGEQSLS